MHGGVPVHAMRMLREWRAVHFESPLWATCIYGAWPVVCHLCAMRCPRPYAVCPFVLVFRIATIRWCMWRVAPVAVALSQRGSPRVRI